MRKEDLRIVDPLGDLDERRETKDERWDEFDESDDEDALRHPERSEGSSDNSSGFTPGIRPMEPLQPSRFRRQLHKARVATNGVGHDRAEPLVHEPTANVQRRKMSAAPGNRHPEQSEGSSKVQSKLIDLERQMKEAAARLDFEEAARIRDIIRSMNV